MLLAEEKVHRSRLEQVSCVQSMCEASTAGVSEQVPGNGIRGSWKGLQGCME